MKAEPFDRQLGDRFGASRIGRDVPLAPFTTFKVGGAADWLIDLRDQIELADLLAIASACEQPVTVLGGGSNVLISDAGVRGVAVRLRGGVVERIDADRIRAHAGVTINGLVRWTLTNGLAGLEAWAGTPGTVGGAVHGNAHFKGRSIGELVTAGNLVTPEGEAREVPRAEMQFRYDYSRLQQTGEILVSADFVVRPGDPIALRAVARESLAFRKRTQPLASPSAGCIFQNPDPSRDHVPDGIPYSAGALVDRAGLKGAAEGQARVSPTHGNFIVNEGGATAAQIRALIERCRIEVRSRFGVELREEIVYLGFGRTGGEKVADGEAED